MLTIGILLCYLLGLSVLLLISRKFSLAELVSYSFLVGIGIETCFLFALDVLNITYSQSILVILNLVFTGLFLLLNYKNLSEVKEAFKLPTLKTEQINFVAVFIFFFIAYLFYAITVKNLFWPPTEHDTIGSFDKLGRLMALEGKLKISLFQYHLEGAGGVYPPLFHGSFAYVYLFGAEMPKIITTLFFLSLLTGFYSLVKNYIGSTVAMLFTFLLMITPELFSHAALSLGNLPTTAYVACGGLATITWIDKRDEKYFWVGAILMAFVIWIRSDTVVFTAAALLIMVINFLKDKDWKKFITYCAISVAPFVIWALYLKFKIATGSTAGKFDLGMGYNAERMDVVGGYTKAFLFGGQKGAIDGGQLYGIAFILFFIMLLVNIISIYKNGWKEILVDKMNLLLFFFVSFGMYFMLFYFINVEVQRAPIASLMESSFKRGLFCFIPLALFYAATSKVSTALFNRLEKFRLGL